MRGKDRRPTFKAIVDMVEATNGEELMKRAQLANRLAKLVEGPSKQRAYAVKRRALRALAQRFPHRVYINRDPVRPHLLLVNSLARPWGLHAPVELFDGYQLNDHAA
jgi:hypothetical protein